MSSSPPPTSSSSSSTEPQPDHPSVNDLNTSTSSSVPSTTGMTTSVTISSMPSANLSVDRYHNNLALFSPNPPSSSIPVAVVGTQSPPHVTKNDSNTSTSVPSSPADAHLANTAAGYPTTQLTTPTSSPLPPAGELSSLRRQLADAERLIIALNKDNAKLHSELKAQEMIVKNAEFKVIEENKLLRNQMQECKSELQRYQNVHSSMINDAAAGEISKLKQKLVELTHSSTAEKAILKAEMDKLRKLLQDEKEKHADADVDHVNFLKNSLLELRTAYDSLASHSGAELSNLRDKLAWYVANQPLIFNLKKQIRVSEIKQQFLLSQINNYINFLPNDNEVRKAALKKEEEIKKHYEEMIRKAQEINDDEDQDYQSIQVSTNHTYKPTKYNPQVEGKQHPVTSVHQEGTTQTASGTTSVSTHDDKSSISSASSLPSFIPTPSTRSDQKRIKQLELQVSQLQQQVKSKQDPVAGMIAAARPSMEESEVINELREQISELQKKLLASDESYMIRIRALRQETDQLRLLYEKRIDKLKSQIKQARPVVSSKAELTSRTSLRVKELEAQVNDIRTIYRMKMKNLHEIIRNLLQHTQASQGDNTMNHFGLSPALLQAISASQYEHDDDDVVVGSSHQHHDEQEVDEEQQKKMESSQSHTADRQEDIELARSPMKLRPQAQSSSVLASPTTDSSQAHLQNHTKPTSQNLLQTPQPAAISPTLYTTSHYSSQSSSEDHPFSETTKPLSDDLDQLRKWKFIMQENLAQVKKMYEEDAEIKNSIIEQLRSDLSRIRTEWANEVRAKTTLQEQIVGLEVALEKVKHQPSYTEYQAVQHKVELMSLKLAQREKEYEQEAHLLREGVKAERLYFEQKYNDMLRQKNAQIAKFQEQLSELLQALEFFEKQQRQSYEKELRAPVYSPSAAHSSQQHSHTYHAASSPIPPPQRMADATSSNVVPTSLSGGDRAELIEDLSDLLPLHHRKDPISLSQEARMSNKENFAKEVNLKWAKLFPQTTNGVEK